MSLTSDHFRMDYLPTELWCHILTFTEKRDLASASRTCISLRILVQSFLYEDIDFTSRNDGAVDTFVRSITEQPMLAVLVRNLTLVPLGSGGAPPLTAMKGCNSSHPILAQISSFIHLRSLTLHGFYIDSRLRNALRQLPELSSLTFFTCACDLKEVPGTDAETAWRSTSLDLRLTFPNSGNGWYLLMPAALRSLHLSTLHAHPILSDLLLSNRSDPMINFTTLILVTTFPDNIISVLASCPQLRRISLPRVTKLRLALLLSLPPRAIPLLEDFSGHAEYTEIFIQGRPVHTATILISPGTPADSDVLRSLEFSTVPVRSLCVDGKVPPGMLQHAPISLHSLTWAEWLDPSLLESIERVTALSRLRSLRILKWKMLDHGRKDFVQAASMVCNSLKKIVFEAGRGRSRWKGEVWHRRNEGAWSVEIFRWTGEYPEYIPFNALHQ